MSLVQSQLKGLLKVWQSKLVAPSSLTRKAFQGHQSLARSSHRGTAPSPHHFRFARTMTAATAQATTPAVMEKPAEKFRKDYTPPPYMVDTVNLNFVLGEEVTRVESKLRMAINTQDGRPADIFLNGRKDVELVSVTINGSPLSKQSYQVTSTGLTLPAAVLPPDASFDLDIVTHIKPQDNSLLEGLYKSGGNFCTQCEAEGFRGITFFLDRPDVMAKYTTRIEADKALYPVLLSNGNLIESGDLEGGKHYTVWEDPFKKPCYLFALVAGNLAVQEDHFITCSGRKVTLRIFVQHKNIHKVDFAMESLKRSMKWDEDTFGLEYDLDIFNIVAVDDFNMGAMENKSLNIFNSRLVLATPDEATDGDFARIEGVVGHEYFHNYTGNRVTCRDWFQLTLKEGLTVYRDQEFSADMNSRPVKRIEDVVRLRAAQFTEDAGPTAHPIRPESYIKMDNFYTLSVYEKGSEVVRVYESILGKEGFRKGMDLYFARHDGQAVTCDDFRAAMADANGFDLAIMERWYSQAGTPHLTVNCSYNATDKTFTINMKQKINPTPGQDEKLPVLIPVRTALLGADGQALPLKLQGSGKDLGTETVLSVTEAEQEFVFVDVAAKPVPSLLRGFSAPVKMHIETQSDEDLIFILANDTDAFNRWEAGQVLAKKLMLQLYSAAAASANGAADGVSGALQAVGGVPASIIGAYRSLLEDEKLDGQFKAFAMSLPADSELVDLINEVDPVLLHAVRHFVVKQLATHLRPQLEAAVKGQDALGGGPYEFNAEAVAGRALKNKALGYLAALQDEGISADLVQRFRAASNMTDEMGALAALDYAGGPARDAALDEFYKKWQNEPLVILKWITIQAMSNTSGNLDRVQALVQHPAFNINNPNNCYSLFLAFARSPVNFHAADGKGYEFMADAVLKVDGINHQVAARMVSAFTTWKQFDTKRQGLMKEQLKRILAAPGLSENVFEIANKAVV